MIVASEDRTIEQLSFNCQVETLDEGILPWRLRRSFKRL